MNTAIAIEEQERELEELLLRVMKAPLQPTEDAVSALAKEVAALQAVLSQMEASVGAAGASIDDVAKDQRKLLTAIEDSSKKVPERVGAELRPQFEAVGTQLAESGKQQTELLRAALDAFAGKWRQTQVEVERQQAQAASRLDALHSSVKEELLVLARSQSHNAERHALANSELQASVQAQNEPLAALLMRQGELMQHLRAIALTQVHAEERHVSSTLELQEALTHVQDRISGVAKEHQELRRHLTSEVSRAMQKAHRPLHWMLALLLSSSVAGFALAAAAYWR